ncbi:MAG: replication endonuclease [Campylobacteraceae bacterium]|nr:replication endonuclease [Campylobacteraceae bacterium]
MNYTQSTNTNALEEIDCAVHAHFALCCTVDSAEGSLTNYKEVVDIDENYSFYDYNKPLHYGLSPIDLSIVKEKLRNQKSFLNCSFLHDRINKTLIPLADLVISVYHSPERYYAEIQNRVNTLETIAKKRDLKPIFMTLTLPSEFHKFKTTKSGKQIKNPTYNGTNPKESVKVLTKMYAKLRQDRSLKELSKEERIYFRVNEPHKDGTPHTHILMFIPSDRIERVKKAYERLYDNRANDIQVVTDDINNSVAYVMKYVNKVLPLSKKKNLSEKE